MPPESFPAGRSRNGARPVLSSSSAIRASRSARSWPNRRPKKSHVLEHRQGGIEVLAQPLRHVGDARADGAAMGGVGDVAAQHLDAALLHRPGAGEERHQAGFADAVRADQAHHAIGGNIQAEAVQGERLAIAEGYVLNADDGGHGSGAHGRGGGSRTSSEAGQDAAGSILT